MVRIIMASVLSLVSLCAEAQVTVNVQLPGGGMVQKDQLWNLVVVNNNNTTIEVVVSLDIQDAVTGQTVLSAVGRGFMLGKGVKVINIRDVQPVQYNYIATELNGTYIPLGNYIACYRVSKKDIRPETAADECVRLNIVPLSPPLLNTPADRSVSETSYPQFSWSPPAPMDMFSNLNYDLVVAEIQDGQSAAEAVLYNTPVYTTTNVKTAFASYPSGFSKLKSGQQYAWQVTARNGLNYSAQTEVWSFAVKQQDSVKADASSSEYVLLGNGQSGISYITGNVLKLKFYSFEKKYKGVLRITDDKGKLITLTKEEIVYGDNFITLKLNNKFEKEIIYKIQITDTQKGMYSSRFIIR